MDNAQTGNSAACGQSRSTVGLERMFRVAKTDHPDLVGGIVWADCELAWINERITLAILAEREACATVCADLKAKAETAAKVHCGLNSVAFAEAYQHAEGAIRMRSNVDVTGPRLRGSGGQQGSTAQPPSSGD